MKKIEEIVNYINKEFDQPIDIAMILGSGLATLTEEFEVIKEISYIDIPHFKASEVVGHASKLVFAKHNNKNILFFKGRFHYYEGYEIDEVVLPVRVVAQLKVKNLIVTNACGGVADFLNPGDLMLINDHIGLFCPSPLRGKNYDNFGTRFPDMSQAYDKNLQTLALTCAKDLSIDLKQGVYAYFKGPMYETPAEIRAYKALGSDAVGMSTVPEVIVAHHAGIKVLGISLITNKAAGLGGNLNHQEVIEVAGQSEVKFKKLVKEIIERI
ncbi:purine-nucleoside phosphorylase [Spiroplasma culicicola]|uniref:Purine nucleoside phosphorylase n=1 Tax=Spiroplasma culicicola AES-1 TaxID=1276246 RepID=W6A621_9MOLU|nr:purine-nucleoside phosphorylase [Spiroplasma culicicola]AHI52442.1 purine nucleoside phosphorylase [Spiroplasma culicicola AES-1]